MTLQKIEFEYDIPGGYRFVRYDVPKVGDDYLSKGIVRTADYDHDCEWPIVEKIPSPPYPQNTKRHKHADLIHAWAEGAEIQYKKPDGSWDDVFKNHPTWNDKEIYRIKPKTKTVRFRNFMHTIGSVMATDKDISNEFYFAKWLGDWQEVEVEE